MALQPYYVLYLLYGVYHGNWYAPRTGTPQRHEIERAHPHESRAWYRILLTRSYSGRQARRWVARARDVTLRTCEHCDGHVPCAGARPRAPHTALRSGTALPISVAVPTRQSAVAAAWRAGGWRPGGWRRRAHLACGVQLSSRTWQFHAWDACASRWRNVPRALAGPFISISLSLSSPAPGSLLPWHVCIASRAACCCCTQRAGTASRMPSLTCCHGGGRREALGPWRQCCERLRASHDGRP